MAVCGPMVLQPGSTPKEPFVAIEERENAADEGRGSGEYGPCWILQEAWRETKMRRWEERRGVKHAAGIGREAGWDSLWGIALRGHAPLDSPKDAQVHRRISALATRAMYHFLTRSRTKAASVALAKETQASAEATQQSPDSSFAVLCESSPLSLPLFPCEREAGSDEMQGKGGMLAPEDQG